VRGFFGTYGQKERSWISSPLIVSEWLTREKAMFPRQNRIQQFEEHRAAMREPNRRSYWRLLISPFEKSVRQGFGLLFRSAQNAIPITTNAT
jgi:hypothetical protein